jgi:hypothetical protein
LRIAIVCLAVILAAPPSFARTDRHPDPREPSARTPRGEVVWYDDMESGAIGWTHGDFTDSTPRFHVDSYRAYDDPLYDDDRSWWCGELNESYAGGDGYGNSWDQRLELPLVDIGAVNVERTSWGAIKAMYRDEIEPPTERPVRTVIPILTFAYRYDSEAGYDFTRVEVESAGVWVPMNRDFTGRSGGWSDLGSDGYDLSHFGSPLAIRFRFISDGNYSDEDGLYISDGGAFEVDGIRIYDQLTGNVLFYEDCQEGPPACVPTVPEAAGDYWHLVDSSCQAASGTRAWSIAWPDSTAVPPNLQNWLQTPVIDISEFWGARSCTLWVEAQFLMPHEWGGGWTEEATTDGGATWTMVGNWDGDQCSYGYGPCDHFLFYVPIKPEAGSGTSVAVRWKVHTDAQGSYAGTGCSYESSGIVIDDCWIEVSGIP